MSKYHWEDDPKHLFVEVLLVDTIRYTITLTFCPRLLNTVENLLRIKSVVVLGSL